MSVLSVSSFFSPLNFSSFKVVTSCQALENALENALEPQASLLEIHLSSLAILSLVQPPLVQALPSSPSLLVLPSFPPFLLPFPPFPPTELNEASLFAF